MGQQDVGVYKKPDPPPLKKRKFMALSAIMPPDSQTGQIYVAHISFIFLAKGVGIIFRIYFTYFIQMKPRKV